MGTRASFFIGDPRNLSERKWLGCIAFDGYPDARDISTIRKSSNQKDFTSAVLALKKRRDFADPKIHGWPFPWQDDLFLTDYTYAWFDDKAWLSCFHHGFVEARDLRKLKKYFNGDSEDDPSLDNVPAPTQYDQNAPDSIMVISRNKVLV